MSKCPFLRNDLSVAERKNERLAHRRVRTSDASVWDGAGFVGQCAQVGPVGDWESRNVLETGLRLELVLDRESPVGRSERKFGHVGSGEQTLMLQQVDRNHSANTPQTLDFNYN